MIAPHFFANISSQMPKVYHQSALQIGEALLGKGVLDMARMLVERMIQKAER